VGGAAMTEIAVEAANAKNTCLVIIVPLLVVELV
jgi:hypothetical protein